MLRRIQFSFLTGLPEMPTVRAYRDEYERDVPHTLHNLRSMPNVRGISIDQGREEGWLAYVRYLETVETAVGFAVKMA